MSNHPETRDITVIYQLENWTPWCDWGGCKRTPTDGYAFCAGHRKSQTIAYDARKLTDGGDER